MPFPGQVFDKLNLTEGIVAHQMQMMALPVPVVHLVEKRSVARIPVVRRTKLVIESPVQTKSSFCAADSIFCADSATEFASGRPKRKASVMTCSYTYDPLEALIDERRSYRRRSRSTTIVQDGKGDDTDRKDKMEDEDDREDDNNDGDNDDKDDNSGSHSSDKTPFETKFQTSCQSETASPATRHGRTVSMHTVNTATTFESELSATDDACSSDNELYQRAMLRPERSDHSLFSDPRAMMCNLNHSYSQYCDSFEQEYDNWDAYPRLSTLRRGAGDEELASDEILSACGTFFSDDSDDILSVLQDLVCMDTAV